jgi:predicted ArsR family transcriptional regulator
VRSGDRDQHVRAVARLAEPVRRRLYDYVVSRDVPTSREEAAAATGISRSLAAYHLDKLVEDGLLATSYARTSGRTGPGAGRTAKLYQRSAAEVVVTVPSRDYELAASLLADAVEQDPTGAVKSALNECAHRVGMEAGHLRAAEGRATGGRGSPVHGALVARGYEPQDDADGTVRLRNCPFHRLVANHRDMVCEMNLSLVTGLLESIGDRRRRAVLDPRPGYCCVAVMRTGVPSDPA